MALKQYVSAEYYKGTYNGIYDGSENELNRLLQFATLKVDGLTMNRIVDFNELTPFQQEMVSLAVCVQTDYTLANGDADNVENNIASYTSLDISVSLNTNQSQFKQMLSEHGISMEAHDILVQTGLMWRGV